MSASKRTLRALAATLRLLLPHRFRAIGVDMASIGEVQFCVSVLREYARRRPQDRFYVFHRDSTGGEFDALCSDLKDRVVHYRYAMILLPVFRRLNLYLTTEQFVPGPPGVYTLTMFHGQPAKGLTFRLPFGDVVADALLANDALFLYGPLQRQTLEEHLQIWNQSLPAHLELFEIGYPKSDALLRGTFDRTTVLSQMGLDPGRTTILYAPAFNEGASMRECGVEVLRALCSLENCNVLAKLAIDCLQPTSNSYATGGVNWFEAIGRLEREYPHFRLVRDLEADPALAASDVLVTCISSIGFEFLALRRPVIYLDTPKFFSETLPAFFPGRDLSGWENRTCVNGGREYGLLVSRPEELPEAVRTVLSHPAEFPRHRDELPDRLVYHPGRASGAAVDRIELLLEKKVRSRRPGDQGRAIVLRLLRWDSPGRRVRRKMSAWAKRAIAATVQPALNRLGYELRKTGQDYIPARETIAAAQAEGLSICDYLERKDADPAKRGRRDRIVAGLEKMGVFENARAICEIGAGTGQYLERVLGIARPQRYEVYETDAGWTAFLRLEYGSSPSSPVVCHAADGRSLRQTSTETCDLVHAHGVFVYLPIVQVFEYLAECVRVCRPGGCIVFDCYTEEEFPLPVLEAWAKGVHRFPVVLPRALLSAFVDRHGLIEAAAFNMPHASGQVKYVVWRKPAGQGDVQRES